MTIDVIEAVLVRKEAELARLRLSTDALEREVEALKTTIRVLKDVEMAAPEREPPVERERERDPTPTQADKGHPISLGKVPKDSPFYGKGIPDASFLALSMSAEPMTPAEIVAVLKEAGFVFGGRHPASNVYWALRNRSRDKGDVLSLKLGKWAIAERVDEPESVKAVRAGLENARARGTRLGPPLKFTDEQMALAQRLVDEGVSVTMVANRLGVSKQAIYKRCRVERRSRSPKKPSESKPVGPLH